jgi:hypothetical protein
VQIDIGISFDVLLVLIVAVCLTGKMGFLFFDGGRGNKTPLGLYLTKSLANALNYLEIEMMSIFEINFFTCLSYLSEYVT